MGRRRVLEIDHALKKRIHQERCLVRRSSKRAITSAACAADDRYAATVRALRSPLHESAEQAALLRELVRCATLAANGHNTQPWKFGLSPDTILTRPDLSRCTPVVDPDEHHLWVSLGCPTENLALAAAALGKHADVAFGPQGVHVAHFAEPTRPFSV